MKALLLTALVLAAAAPARAFDKPRACSDFQAAAQDAVQLMKDTKPDMDKMKEDLEKQQKNLADAQKKLRQDQARYQAATNNNEKATIKMDIQADQSQVNAYQMGVATVKNGSSDANKSYQRAMNIFVLARNGGQVLECPVSATPPGGFASYQPVSDDGNNQASSGGASWGHPSGGGSGGNGSNNAHADVDCPPGMHPIGHGKCQRDQYGGGTRSDNPANYFKNRH